MVGGLFKRFQGGPRLVLIGLFAVVLVPTVCVLWFMNKAMENERLAVRQRLLTVYRGELADLRDELRETWQHMELTVARGDQPAHVRFAEYVREGLADSVVFYDDAQTPLWPADVPPGPEPEPRDSGWGDAARLEFRERDFTAAAHAYQAIAGRSINPNHAAGAYLAGGRCLLKAGETVAGLTLLRETFTSETYRDAVDRQGRTIAHAALLLYLEKADPASPEFERVARLLHQWLEDYSNPLPNARQRRFLMTRTRELAPLIDNFSTLAAENMAADYLSSAPGAPGLPRLEALPEPGRWRRAFLDGRVVALFGTAHLKNLFARLLQNAGLPDDLHVALLLPDSPPQKNALVAIPAGDFMPGWQLSLSLDAPSNLDSAAEEKVAVYLWTGLLVIATIVMMALAAAGYLGRQVKVTALKNDLVATVSHELKTPLSSMRLLVETLLEGHYRDPELTREYLELIEKENARLSRLIENFLLFSRIERNKQSFERRETDMGHVAQDALESIGEKLQLGGFEVRTEIQPNLPPVLADPDALVTVALNLLDNAYKYSTDTKLINLRVFVSGSRVCLEVEDRGIGLSKRDAKRVFERFYQVDRRLARSAEGCGLGLNIVQFIVKAHQGEITLDSEPGKGSVFRVTLPVLRHTGREAETLRNEVLPGGSHGG